MSWVDARVIRLGEITTTIESGRNYAAALDRWIPWSRDEGGSNGARIDSPIRFSLRDDQPFVPPPGPPLVSVGAVSLWRDESTIVVSGPPGLSGRVDLERAVGSASAPPGDPDSAWKVVHGYLRLLWHLALARRGLHAVHASGVVVDGKAILMTGKSGAGKSTLAARLAEAGGSLLSDDTVFVDAGTGDVIGMGDTSRLLEVGADLPRANGRDPDGKITVPARVITKGPARPALLLFLDAEPTPAVRYEAMTPADAMAGLLRAGFSNIDPASGASRLAALGRLVEFCPAFRLSRGPQPPSPSLLQELMELARQ